MGYYVQHKIYLKDNSREKLELLQNLLEQYFCRLEIENNTVYDDDGEPMEMLCLSDAQWNFGSGTTWYTFDMNVADVSVTFNEKYPNETIYVYTKSEKAMKRRIVLRMEAAAVIRLHTIGKNWKKYASNWTLTRLKLVVDCTTYRWLKDILLYVSVMAHTR